MNLTEWFNKGLTAQEYILGMNENQDKLLQIYQQYEPSEEATIQMNPIIKKHMKAIVLTEDWCGDAMVNVPIFLKLAQDCLIDVSFLHRDQHLELMDQYLTNGKARSIPIIVFLDAEGTELGKWGPRAQEIEKVVSNLKSELPEQGTEEYKHLFKEQFIPKMHKLFLEKETWKQIELDLMETMKRLKEI
ncbi:hypothetical protein JOC54_004527 [Alkalihalobacillus xiaoxiensis]|uniref:Thioredoxin n=1 Tax=Shouchella xiaoxiensis TaxID=766895 RepID=A0ABS2T1U3_9BACI|nr:thioredoxin family protein [Shouchella xiaoxiensis]MBM7841226.1 hypothetical protein [Shouchella xiaoxiensis]